MGKKGDKMTGGSTAAAEKVQDGLAPLGDIRIRKMFGGHGIFMEESMFALVDSAGTIFFKADASNIGLFEAAGSEKHGRMPYFRVPEGVLSEAALLQEWAQNSIRVAKKVK